MGDGNLERRLTTILAADAVGYSRLMAADEAGTLAEINAIRDRLIEPRLRGFRGRIVKLIGDGILMEFGSVVDAISFATNLQEEMGERNASLSAEKQIAYRIGINIGDVIVEGDDIYGDGVNVAARLESLAEPGGVCISRTVLDQVKGKVEFTFEDLGAQKVKNIPEPVHVFRVHGDTPPTRLGATGDNDKAPRIWRAISGVAVLLLAIAGFLFWQRPWETRVEPAREAEMAFPLPDKPSIAILPFNNLSDDASQEYFADGMTEDLITDLSKISGLFVIARNSSFAYKGTQVKIRDVAEDLGVRYVLEGSVRRIGDKLRVNAQLIDATTGGHIWADRFDGDTADVFAVQDRFVFKIVTALELKLTQSEKSEIEKSDTKKVDAREEFQKGWEFYSRFNEQDNARAVPHFESAVELDPEYGRAYGALALVHLRGSIFDWHRAMGKSSAQLYRELVPFYLAKAKEYPNALVHVVAALKHLFYWDQVAAEGSNRGTDDARIEAGNAIALQPNDPEAHIAKAWAMIASGKPEEGLSFVQAAKRLDPNFPSHYVFFDAAAHFALGNLEQAAGILSQGMTRDPRARELAPLAASIQARLGQRKEAQEAIMKWQSGLNSSDLQNAAKHYAFPIRWVNEQKDLNELLLDGLQLASLPLEVTVKSLTAELGEGSPLERLKTIRSLGWFGASAAESVPQLTAALEDTHKGVRKEAIIALGKIGPEAKAALPTIEAFTQEPIVGYHAKVALRRINGE